MFFSFPEEDARWNADLQAVEFGVGIGEYDALCACGGLSSAALSTAPSGYRAVHEHLSRCRIPVRAPGLREAGVEGDPLRATAILAVIAVNYPAAAHTPGR